MNLSKVQKIVLGIFTVLPFILFPIIFWQVFHMIIDIVRMSEQGEPEASQIVMAVFSFLVPILLLTFGCLALLIFYIVHAISNKKLEPAEQLLWVLLFIFFGIIAFPIYWFVRIWNNGNVP
jgi:hypothetical protein